jgi:hypothetical protein
MKRLPVLVSRESVVMRAGTLKSINVQCENIVAVATQIPPGFPRRAGVLNLGLLAYPNVALELRRPLATRHRGTPVAWVAHRLDDPAAFIAALSAR